MMIVVRMMMITHHTKSRAHWQRHIDDDELVKIQLERKRKTRSQISEHSQ